MHSFDLHPWRERVFSNPQDCPPYVRYATTVRRVQRDQWSKILSGSWGSKGGDGPDTLLCFLMLALRFWISAIDALVAGFGDRLSVNLFPSRRIEVSEAEFCIAIGRLGFGGGLCLWGR